MGKRPPRPLTKSRLMRYADWYLERWAATEKSLSRALWRRADRVMRHHPADRDEVAGWIRHTIAFALEQGFVNDEAYARDVIRSHRRRGVASRKTRSKLLLKGVAASTIDALMADAAPDLELTSAFKYARRRRLGPYRRRPTDREGKQKELAKLARAGFPFDVARHVIDASEQDAEGFIETPWR